MKWFNDLRVASKLLLSFLALAVILDGQLIDAKSRRNLTQEQLNTIYAKAFVHVNVPVYGTPTLAVVGSPDRLIDMSEPVVVPDGQSGIKMLQDGRIELTPPARVSRTQASTAASRGGR